MNSLPALWDSAILLTLGFLLPQLFPHAQNQHGVERLTRNSTGMNFSIRVTSHHNRPTYALHKSREFKHRSQHTLGEKWWLPFLGIAAGFYLRMA